MKNKNLKRIETSILPKMNHDEILEHKRERNRRKRYNQGRIDLYTLTGKKRKNEQNLV